MKPCLKCGTLMAKDGACETCAWRPGIPSLSKAERGYDAAWRRLSKRARKKQPFCARCGTVNDLQCDHTPQAWERWKRGLPIRLEDVQVLCGRCNREEGPARGGLRSRRRAKSLFGMGRGDLARGSDVSPQQEGASGVTERRGPLTPHEPLGEGSDDAQALAWRQDAHTRGVSS